MIDLSDGRQQFIGHLKGKDRSSATILAYGKDIEQLVEYCKKEGKEDASEVSTEDLKSFMEQLTGNGYTAKSISRKTNSTKTFFKFLKSSHYLESDPATPLEHPDFETKPPRILSKMEYRALRDAARGDLRISAVIELLLQTGIRIGELSKITTSDINLDQESPALHIRPDEGTVKRTIPLTKSVVEALKKYLETRPARIATPTRNNAASSGKQSVAGGPKTQNKQSFSASKALFITKTGKPLLIRNIRTAIDRYFRLASVKTAKVNDLRHTWVAHQLASGISLTLVSRLAGHKRVSTTEKYLHHIPTRASEDKIKLEEL